MQSNSTLSTEIDARLEERHKVALRARIRAAGLPLDICIRDISTSGIMAQMDCPPARGTFVEILYSGHFLTGQVRWTSDRRFGIVLQDKIDVKTFICGRLAESGAAATGPFPDRRSAPRTGLPDLERNRALSSRMQFASTVFVLAAFAVFMANEIYASVSGVTEQVTAAFDGAQT